jgi:hypothetical protein
MVATAFAIFNATKTLPPRNNLPPWAENTKIWPQVVILSIACVSLVMSIVVMIAYLRGGHNRAEKVAAYYTVFAVGFFVFSIVMWGIGAAVLNQSKANNNNKDMWGWSCVDNKRRHLFEDDISYALVCRLQVSFTTLPNSQTHTDNPQELGPRLLHHRSRRRAPLRYHLRHRLLPLLVQAQAPQVHGHARPRPLRSLPRATTLPIRSQHPRLWSSLPPLRRLAPTARPPNVRGPAQCRRSWRIRQSAVRLCSRNRAASTLHPRRSSYQGHGCYAQDEPGWF